MEVWSQCKNGNFNGSRDLQDDNESWFERERKLQDQQELVKARGYAEEMRRLYRELEEHAATLQEENEELGIQVLPYPTHKFLF